MKYRFISDSHTHSEYSFDGKEKIMMMAERAYQLGLYSLTITDHCECQEYYQQQVGQSLRGDVRDLVKARAYYQNRLKIYIGIELGQPTQDPAAAKEALSLADYDFVLGSLHNLRGEQDFYFLEYTPDNVPELLDRYYRELLELAVSNSFDSLAHLTYPYRYIAANPEISVRPEQAMEQIDAVLEVLVRNHRALEVNTSGLRQRIHQTLPDETVVRRFRELGGKYVTIGSDAHRWGDVGAGIEEGFEMLLRCGFTHFTVYHQHQPEMLPIL